LAEDIAATVYEFHDDHQPSELLGTWEYSRKDRLITLVWNVPVWFEEQVGDIYIENVEDICNPCKDWFINAP
jgi:hypothetical protein